MWKKSVCRTCLASNLDLRDIFGTSLQGFVEKMLPVPLSFDDKQFLTCNYCHWQITKSYKFMLRVSEADQFLAQLDNEDLVPESPFKNNLKWQTLPHLTISPDEGSENPTLITENTQSKQFITINQGNIELMNKTKLTIRNVKKKSTISENEDNRKGDADMETLETPKATVKSEDTSYFLTIDIEPSYSDDDGDEMRNIKTENCDDELQEDTQYDTEDDLPLKTVSASAVKKKRVRNQKKANPQNRLEAISQVARVYELTREEQLAELQARATTDGYVHALLKCQVCFKGFMDSQAYEDHCLRHNESSGPLVCPICQLRYRSGRQLRAHQLAAHARRFECLRANCGNVSRTVNVPTEAPDATASTSATLPKIAASKSDAERLRKYRQRKAASMTHEQMIAARKLHAERMRIYRLRKATSSMDDQPEKPVAAPKSKAEKSREYRQRMAATRTAAEALAKREIDRERQRRNQARDHEKWHVGQNYPCKLCDQKFNKPAQYMRHMRKWHPAERQGLATDTDQVQSRDGPHSEKRYACPECPKLFETKNQRRIHVRLHTDERPYVCDICQKAFRVKRTLTTHYRIHTGEKPYACPHCPWSFNQSCALKLHVTKKHPDATT